MSERKVLIERFKNNTPLTYIAESGVNTAGKHYIGRLEGPAADLINPTRNNRKYGIELWRNVENSDDFKEGMETLTIFGEADHPEERLETSIKEIAVCLRKFEIRESEGIVWCSFDILDTPNGRIVKELLDYGSKLGVSSRGSGEEVENPVTGENEIDPNTYLFICFDVVIMPAVKQARPSVVESKQYKLTESIQKEIEDATTVSELNSIKTMIEKTLPDNDSLLESINNKLNDLDSGDNISTKLTHDLDESIKRIHELEEHNDKLQKKLSAHNMRLSEMRKLIIDMKSNSKTMRETMKESRNKVSKLDESILDYKARNKMLHKRYDNLRLDNSKLQREITSLKSENSRLLRLNDKIKDENTRKLDDLKSKITESRSIESQRVTRLNDENEALVTKIENSNRKLKSMELRESKLNEECESIKRINNSLKKENMTILSKYLKVKSNQSGFSSDMVLKNLPENYTSSDVDKVIAEMTDQKLRMNRLPINLSNVDMIKMTESRELDSEDVQTISILKSVMNNKIEKD